MSWVVRLRDYCYAYPGAESFVLRDVSLEIGTGECHCLTGPTGSGKTTLALALKGLLPPGRRQGELTAFGPSKGEGAAIGVVLQNPETQLLASSVGGEAAFGLENLCVAPGSMEDMVREALSEVGLSRPLDYKTGKLSMGQKYRLVMASHLVMKPRLLILDEPAAQLDPAGLAKLADIIRELKKNGVSFLLCENQPEPFRREVDIFRHLAPDGTLHPGGYCSPASFPERNCGSTVRRPPPEGAEDVVTARDLAVRGDDGKPIWSGVSFSVARGRRAVVLGVNGAGKTTLIRCLMGFVRPSEGEVRILGGKPVPGSLRGKVGCLFQNPQKQLFENTVFEEAAFSLKRLGQNGSGAAAKVHETLALCGIENLAACSPHKLSYGQKHLVALASVLAFDPEVLLLDDPFAGLDEEKRERVLAVLESLNEERSTTIILTSHSPGALPHWADLTLCMEEGRIVAQ